jgi:hypothetical protein
MKLHDFSSSLPPLRSVLYLCFPHSFSGSGGPAIEQPGQFVGIPERLLSAGAVESFSHAGDLPAVFGIHPVNADDKTPRRQILFHVNSPSFCRFQKKL